MTCSFWGGGGNNIAAEMFASLNSRIAMLRWTTPVESPAVSSKWVLELEDVIEAIRRRDPAGTEEACVRTCEQCGPGSPGRSWARQTAPSGTPHGLEPSAIERNFRPPRPRPGLGRLFASGQLNSLRCDVPPLPVPPLVLRAFRPAFMIRTERGVLLSEDPLRGSTTFASSFIRRDPP